MSINKQDLLLFINQSFSYFEFNNASIKRCRSLKQPNDVIAANTSASISPSFGMIVVY
jgi:hypothetical protein